HHARETRASTRVTETTDAARTRGGRAVDSAGEVHVRAQAQVDRYGTVRGGVRRAGGRGVDHVHHAGGGARVPRGGDREGRPEVAMRYRVARLRHVPARWIGVEPAAGDAVVSAVEALKEGPRRRRAARGWAGERSEGQRPGPGDREIAEHIDRNLNAGDVDAAPAAGVEASGAEIRDLRRRPVVQLPPDRRR